MSELICQRTSNRSWNCFSSIKVRTFFDKIGQNVLKLLFLTKNSPFTRNYLFANLTEKSSVNLCPIEKATSDSRNCWKNNYFLKFRSVNLISLWLFSLFAKNKVKSNQISLL